MITTLTIVLLLIALIISMDFNAALFVKIISEEDPTDPNDIEVNFPKCKCSDVPNYKKKRKKKAPICKHENTVTRSINPCATCETTFEQCIDCCQIISEPRTDCI